MSNEVENFAGFEGKVNAQGLRIADLEVLTEQTHNRINDIEGIRDAVNKLQLDFMEERNRTNAELVRLEISLKEAVVDTISKITAQLVANALRADVAETIKEEIASALRNEITTALQSTVIATRPATRDELRGKN
jgi:translation elongation factor EF-4